MEFRALASSSEGCCYVLRSGSLRPLLIDAGIGYAAIQQTLDFRVTSLAGCLLSHSHGDHAKSVPNLLKAGVNVYASAPTWNDLKAIRTHRSRIVSTLREFEVEGWKVRAFDAVHDTDGTFGFLIGTPAGERLLYLTDSAFSLHRFEGLTHIAVECNYSRDVLRRNAIEGAIHKARFSRTVHTHMSLERLIDMLGKNDLSRVQEIHLLHLSDANSDEQEFKRAVMAATGKPVYVAEKRGYLNGV